MTIYAHYTINDKLQIIINATLFPEYDQVSSIAKKFNRPLPQDPSQLEVPNAAVRLLLDTGASCSCICASKMRQYKELGIEPISRIRVSTPSTGREGVWMDVYKMGLLLGGHQSLRVPFHAVPSINLTETDFTAQNIDGLLGMDILRYCHMSLLGSDKRCYLSFHDIKPETPGSRVPPLGLDKEALKMELAH